MKRSSSQINRPWGGGGARRYRKDKCLSLIRQAQTTNKSVTAGKLVTDAQTAKPKFLCERVSFGFYEEKQRVTFVRCG